MPATCTNFLRNMKNKYTAVIKQDSGWWIGWIEEIPGVNSQGKTRAELKSNMRSAVAEALRMKNHLPIFNKVAVP